MKYISKINKLKSFQHNLTISIKKVYKKITSVLLKYPEKSFFGLLGIIFIIIIIGNFISKPKIDNLSQALPPKEISTYSIGAAPKMSVIGKIEKSGVVKIVAQTGGIVQNIYKTEGDTVNRGTWLFWLSTNYQGGTLPTITREIASKNYQFITDNYDTQKDLIGKQRDIANKLNDQSGDLRSITQKSHDDTNNLINLNGEILNSLNQNISYLQSINTDGSKDTDILQLKQAKAGVSQGQLSLQSALRNIDYQSNTDNAPAQLSNMQKDLTLKQLDLQEKSLDLNREISKLNLTVAQISESLMYPTSPVSGTIERIYVQIGQNVNSGTVLATITGTKNSAEAVVSLPENITRKISALEDCMLFLGSKSVAVKPRYISKEPTDGSLNTVLFAIPEIYEKELKNGQSIRIDIPINSIGTNSAMPFIPLDSIYQTQTESYVYIASGSAETGYTAKSQKVTLGQVYGQFVEATDGLHNNDQVITDRNVIDGDQVTIKNN
jgi:multidrug efflux pump subunit AcrA (membrane-fusion protein)